MSPKPLKKRTTVETFRCRRCGLPKKADDYYKSCETDMDINGKMPTCKTCCKEIVDGFVTSEGTVERGFFRACKKLNILYEQDSIEKAAAKIEEAKESGKSIEMMFGVYLRFLFASNVNKDLTFKETISPPTISDKEIENSHLNMEQLEGEWGKGLKAEDYIYLEEELARWESTHRSDTMAEKTLLHHIAYKQLEIRKERLVDPPDPELSRAYLKELQDLMRTAAIDPNKANAAGQGKGKESFSAFIKMIEETEPADYYANKELFKDFDNLEFYFEKYISRPLKNFVMGSRDFNVDTEKEGDDEDDSFDISDMGIEDDVPIAKEEETKKEE